jgi:hypothetical protein
MTISVTIPSVRRSRLWFGLIGGAMAWLLHLIAASIIAEWGCVSGLYQRELWGMTAVTWLLVIVSVLMSLLAVAATWSAYWVDRVYREAEASERPDSTAETHATDVYMARVGLWSSALFVFIIIAQCVPIFFFLREC